MSPMAKCKYYCCTWDGLDKMKTVLNGIAGACSALPIRHEWNAHEQRIASLAASAMVASQVASW